MATECCLSGCLSVSLFVCLSVCLFVLLLFLLLPSALTGDVEACVRSRHGRNSQGFDSSRGKKKKLPGLSCRWSHSSSEMGVGSSLNTELLGCCPMPSKMSALLYSLVRRAPLHAVFSNILGALFRSARAPHRQHHSVQQKMFLVSVVRRLSFCHRKPSHCLFELCQPSFVAIVPLVAVPPLPPCLLCEQRR